MVRWNENVLEDSVQGLLDLYKGDYKRLRQDVNSKGFNGKWTLGGNHRFNKRRHFLLFANCCSLYFIFDFSNITVGGSQNKRC